MSIVKKVEIDGKQVPFKASAAIPRIYRLKFQRDIYKDLSALEKSINQEIKCLIYRNFITDCRCSLSFI